MTQSAASSVGQKMNPFKGGTHIPSCALGATGPWEGNSAVLLESPTKTSDHTEDRALLPCGHPPLPSWARHTPLQKLPRLSSVTVALLSTACHVLMPSECSASSFQTYWGHQALTFYKSLPLSDPQLLGLVNLQASRELDVPSSTAVEQWFSSLLSAQNVCMTWL